MSTNETNKSFNISLLFSYKTEFNADSVEWCPIEPFKNSLVCSNYELQQELGKRLGRIFLFSFSNSELKLKQTLNCPGVLDQKWSHFRINGDILLAVANAVGEIELYKLNNDAQLEKLTSYKVSDTGELLILSLDWSNRTVETNKPDLICSDSKGGVHLLTLEHGCLQHKMSCESHSFEAWIAAFNYWDANVFFSGGDDSLFCKYDTRVSCDPIARNRKHEAGVTSIHVNPKFENVIATGSYDTNIRIWDIRNMKQPKSAKQMPGPVWRLKWDPFSSKHLLAACMLGGNHILSLEENGELETISSFYEHQSMVYGTDWCHLTEQLLDVGDEKNVVIGSCSFYDNLLCICSSYCDKIK